jgi:thiol:disulfide interchange protein DsbC
VNLLAVLHVLLKSWKKEQTKFKGESLAQAVLLQYSTACSGLHDDDQSDEDSCMSLFSTFISPTPLQRCFSLLFSMLVISSTSPASAQSSDDASAIAAIESLLKTTQPDMIIADISKSPVAGLFEVSIQNGQSIYVSSDARFFIPGDLYEAKTDGLINLGETKRNVIRRDKIAALSESDMIVYEPSNGRKATVTVFTDVDCPYCRKLHGEVEALNAMGIAIRYLAYPRTGLNTETSVKMISTWCAADRKAMMTSAKRGGDVPLADCENPVASQYQLGREVGVTGTPALVLEDGTILPGYIPAATLGAYLLVDKAQP